MSSDEAPPSPTTPTRRGAPIKADEAVECVDCKTTTTPLWRRSEQGGLLCNACGLYWKVHHCPRPLKLKSAVGAARRTKPTPPSMKFKGAQSVHTFAFSMTPEDQFTVTRRSERPRRAPDRDRERWAAPATADDEDDEDEQDPEDATPSPAQGSPSTNSLDWDDVDGVARPYSEAVQYGDRVFGLGDCISMHADPHMTPDHREYFAVIRGFVPPAPGQYDRYFLVTWLLARRNMMGAENLRATDFMLGPEEPSPQPMGAISRQLGFRKRFLRSEETSAPVTHLTVRSAPMLNMLPSSSNNNHGYNSSSGPRFPTGVFERMKPMPRLSPVPGFKREDLVSVAKRNGGNLDMDGIDAAATLLSMLTRPVVHVGPDA